LRIAQEPLRRVEMQGLGIGGPSQISCYLWRIRR